MDIGRPESIPETRFEKLTRRIGLYVLAPLLLILTLPVGVHISQSPDWGMKVRHLVIVSVTPAGPAERAGVMVGDRIWAIEGQNISSMVDYWVTIAGEYRLRSRSYLLRRQGMLLTVDVTPERPSQARMVWGYSLWISGLAFFLIGWWVLSRRRDPVARNFFVLCLIFTFFLGDIPDWPAAGYMTVKEITRDLVQLLWPAFFLRFLLHFPSPGKLPSHQKRRHRLLLLPVLPLFLLSLYAQVSRLDPSISRFVALLQNVIFLYFAIYFVAALIIFARKVLRRDRPIQHTKMRVVLFGLVCGLTPFLAGAFLGSFFPDVPIARWEYLGFSLLLVPLSFGLAILRYGALDTAFVIRHGMTYAAMTALLLLVYFVVVGLLGDFLTEHFHVDTQPLTLATVATTALVILPVRRSVQGWIDRAFYPARRANRAAILALGHELSGLIDSKSAAETLLTRLAALYRPERLSLFLSTDGDDLFREVAGVCDGQPVRPVFSLPRDSSLAHHMDLARRPIFTEDFEVVESGAGLERESASFLQRLACELLVPLITGNQLSGFLSFGPKGSGALYSQDDLTNLRLLSIQAAALLESRRLYQESLARKQLETELTVAQEIQSRLLPTESLTLPGIRICGRMDSCHEVGGDYFDYFPLDSETIGFAIADVSGKGIPAALLMTTLRVALHGEAIRYRSPEQVVSRLNHALSNLTSESQFICFFYGTYSIGDRRLRFCNAGMDPPILFRHGRPYRETLSKGGPVLGVNREHRYRCGTLTLNEGDLMLCFTDGLTEQTNENGEFFDSERLIDTIEAGLAQPIEQLRETIFAAVSQFGGLERSDDRTVMILRIIPFTA